MTGSRGRQEQAAGCHFTPPRRGVEKAGCWEAPPGGGTGIAGIWRAMEKNLGDGHLPCPRGTIGGCRQRARETGSRITATFSGEERGGGHWLKVRGCLTRPQRQ